MNTQPAPVMDKIVYTVFQNTAAQKKHELSETWPEIVQRLKAPRVAPEKASLPLLSFGLYGDVRTAKNALRSAENVIAVTGVEGDYDEQQMPMEDAAERIALAGIRAAFYTTPTHAPDAPKWRIIAPLSKEYPPGERARFVARLNGILGGVLSDESFTLSQSFYFGKVEGVDYEVIEVNGDCIDLRPEFDAHAIMPKGKTIADGGTSDSSTDTELREAIRTGQNFHNALRSLSSRLIGRGMEPVDVLAVLNDLMEQSADRGTDRWRERMAEIPRLVESAAAKFRDPRQPRSTPETPDDDRFPPIEVLAAGDEPGERQPGETDFARFSADTAPSEAPAETYIKFRPIHEIIATPTQVNWLLRGILEQRVIVLLAGKRGTFKSFLALHWAMTLALRGVPVFIVSAEGAGLARRVEAWLRVHAPKVDPASLPIYVHEQRVDFSDPLALAKVRAAVEASGMSPELLIVDTFSKNSGALDENSNSDVKAFIGGLDLGLRTPLELSIILVAHTGHGDQSRVRGASALEADTDAALIVSRIGQEPVVTVDRNRFKDAPELPPLVYRADVIDLGRHDDEGQPVTSLVMREGDDATRATIARKSPTGKAQQNILRALRNQQAESKSTVIWTLEDMRKIGRDLGQHKSTARGAVDGLVCSGLLTATIGGHRLADGAA